MASLSGFDTPPLVANFFVNQIYLSNLPSNILLPTAFTSHWYNFVILFDVALSQIYYLLILSLLAIILFLLDRRKLLAVLGNSRPYRLLHYWLMIVVGFVLAERLGVYFGFSFIDWISIVVLFVSWYCAWMFSVGVNDIVDLEIDQISDSRRPLPIGRLRLADYRYFNLLFLLAAVIGGYLLGYYVLFFLLVFIFSYYIYSSPPLRYKRVLLVSTFFIAIATACAVLAGFFLISASKDVVVFPLRLLVAIIVVFTLAANIKDLKDWRGDQHAGIKTIPVIWGQDRGRSIVACLVSAAMILFPLLSGYYQYLATSAAFAALAYFLIKKQFEEKYIFILYFYYLALFIFDYFG